MSTRPSDPPKAPNRKISALDLHADAVLVLEQLREMNARLDKLELHSKSTSASTHWTVIVLLVPMAGAVLLFVLSLLAATGP